MTSSTVTANYAPSAGGVRNDDTTGSSIISNSIIAGNFEGTQRKLAYAVIGGVAGAGIAAGPIIGGWATTELRWRVVFAGEVVLVLLILALVGKVGN